MKIHRVRFLVADPKEFDLDKVKAAFKDVGFNETNLVAAPG